MHLFRVVAIAVVAATGACGGGASAPPDPTDGGQTSNPPGPPPPGTVGVTIKDFSFTRASLTIKAGTTIRWTNQGPSGHTTTSDDGTWASTELSAPQGGGGYGGGGGSLGGSFAFTFTQPGTFHYHCSLHSPSSYPGFTGTVTVTP